MFLDILIFLEWNFILCLIQLLNRFAGPNFSSISGHFLRRPSLWCRQTPFNAPPSVHYWEFPNEFVRFHHMSSRTLNFLFVTVFYKRKNSNYIGILHESILILTLSKQPTNFLKKKSGFVDSGFVKACDEFVIGLVWKANFGLRATSWSTLWDRRR